MEYNKPSEVINREILEDLYCSKKLSAREISKILNVKSCSSIKDKIKEYGLVREKLKTKLRRTWGGVGEISGRYLQSLRNRCKQYKIENNYTPEYLWELFLKQNRKCVYSGLELKFATVINNDGIKEQTASLDRIDSNKGYVNGNLQWVHKTINKMKQELDENTFIEFCRLVSKNYDNNIS